MAQEQQQHLPPRAQALAEKLALLSLDDVLREKHRRSFYAFFVDMFPEMEPGTDYIDAEHQKWLCSLLQAITDGSIENLGIEIGPGYMKSLTAAVAWVAWVWGCRDPGHRFGFSTYADDLTTRDSERCRALIQSPLYQRLYGDKVKLIKWREDKLITSARGLRQAFSVKGQTTGHRVNTWVMDDLLNMVAARSEAERDKVKTHLRAVSSRGQIGKRFCRVIIGQRLHEDDAGAYARKQDWPVLCLPTEYDPSRHCTVYDGTGKLLFTDWRSERGQLLFPEGFGPDKVAQAKVDLLDDYSAQHQQLPVPAEGGVLKTEYIKEYDPAHPPKFGFYFLSIDTAQGTDAKNDTTAICVLGVHRHGIALVDGWTGREAADKVLDYLIGNPEVQIRGFGSLYSPSMTVIEQKDWGKAMLALLEANKRWGWPLKGYVPVVSKDMRAHQAQPFVRRGRLWMPKGHPLTEAAKTQLAVFPKSKVRDLADALVQACIHAEETYTFEASNLPLVVTSARASKSGPTRVTSLFDDDED
jgi:hypothetical protein